MRGGVIPFRGTGADALRYVEADRSRADDYYLGAEATVAQFAALDGSGTVTAELSLDPAAYAGWVDWENPLTGESMGRPRRAGSDRRGSPRFMEMVVNTPKSLSIAAALHPEVSEALDAAQQDALSEIRRWLAQHSVTRVGSLGAQEVVPIEQMQVVGITHRTSRAGDPHRHIHMQIGTRVFAAGKWRGLFTAALFKQQGTIRALGTAVIAASPELAEVLDRHGLTLDPVTGEVAELQPYNAVMSKRGEQVRRNLESLEAAWDQAHPGESMGPVVATRLRAEAWAHERPAKKPTTLREETGWVTELREAGYDPDNLHRRPVQPPVSLDDLSVQELASRTLDRCAAGSSAWTAHTVTEHATRIMAEYGVRATPAEVRDFIAVAARLAVEDCFTIIPSGKPAPEHVAHLTSLRVMQAETELRDLLTARVPARETVLPGVQHLAQAAGLDVGQAEAAAALASTDPLVIVEGAAGSGKTTMLATAITAAQQQGRPTRVVAPTKKAAAVAQKALGVPADSVAALVYAHGYRWNADGVWARLARGDTDPETGRAYTGPPETARLQGGERVVVDEAGMLDQDSALALFTVAAETGATLALVGDRAQLPAIGRGGVLDMTAAIRGRTIDMAEVHRFTDPTYADLTVRLRDRNDPGVIFDQLHAIGLIRLHADAEHLHEHIAQHHGDGEAVTVVTNDEAARLNARIRDQRTHAGLVDDQTTATGSDGLAIGRGDLIQTRKNDTALGVANRQLWIVQHVADDGALWAVEAGSDRKRERTVRLPAAYVTEHAHLAYASTAYGVQGVTAKGSHTILSDAMSGAAVYVGMTRGEDENQLHVIAENPADARQQFIDAIERDRADRGLPDATQRAAEAVRGLVDDGPVKIVNTEIAALTQQAEYAEQRAALWQQAADALGELHATQREERDQAARASETAKRNLEVVRAEVAAPLTEQASAALAEWQTANAAHRAARDRLRTVGRFGKRRAAAEHHTAQALTHDAEQRLTSAWGKPPRWNEDSAAWVERVTRPRIDTDSRVVEATEQRETAAKAVRKTLEPDPWPHLRIYARIFGTETVAKNQAVYLHARPRTNAENQARTAQQARAEIEALRALTPAEAAERIEQTSAAEQTAREDAERALAGRRGQLSVNSRDSGRRHDGPSLGR
ncbi:MobF family relaxase [Ornithinimicrobium sufpigmenti]|uniref:MobF family relaxase n=1 Tax=Ornithinimicrobium sufpigmenti TaxID=2508882 RepID=UPI001035A8E4|nr:MULTISPECIES: MobF family relaxase [unclassified Ornithinimicrobium]